MVAAYVKLLENVLHRALRVSLSLSLLCVVSLCLHVFVSICMYVCMNVCIRVTPLFVSHSRLCVYMVFSFSLYF